jgi:hypothetical protein
VAQDQKRKRKKKNRRKSQRKTNPTTEAFKTANKTKKLSDTNPPDASANAPTNQDSAIEPNKITRHQTPGVLCWT